MCGNRAGGLESQPEGGLSLPSMCDDSPVLISVLFRNKYETFSGEFQVQMAAVKPKRARRQLPPRSEQLTRLQGDEEFDVLIIGGGATGAGCALDSTTRGLKTALVELDDFASGTSSRSTKLIHGGVRYLQKAILGVLIK